LKLAINKLDKFRQQGMDITEIINESVINSWKSFYEQKNNKKQGNKHGKFEQQDYKADTEGFSVIG
jgi:hypothetical protein